MAGGGGQVGGGLALLPPLACGPGKAHVQVAGLSLRLCIQEF